MKFRRFLVMIIALSLIMKWQITAISAAIMLLVSVVYAVFTEVISCQKKV